jgi:hypothetical protein
VANGGGGAVKLAVLRGRVALARVARFSHAAACDPAMKNGWLDGAGGESSPPYLPGLREGLLPDGRDSRAEGGRLGKARLPSSPARLGTPAYRGMPLDVLGQGKLDFPAVPAYIVSISPRSLRWLGAKPSSGRLLHVWRPT